ncbi:hypothetical protein [Verrucomicrobium spinosum]|uniref:hypothetical protein n=1 Tax=Verrucomicrobium spinosum TaxID=2736 RepID=UPI00094675E1|nr:hypothetical protein [Verrucomicrobium spinosum]
MQKQHPSSFVNEIEMEPDTATILFILVTDGDVEFNLWNYRKTSAGVASAQFVLRNKPPFDTQKKFKAEQDKNYDSWIAEIKKLGGEAEALLAASAGAVAGEPMTKKNEKSAMSDAELAKAIKVDLDKCVAVAEKFVDHMEAGRLAEGVALMSDRTFESISRPEFIKKLEKSNQVFGKLKKFVPDKKATDFGVKGGIMTFILQGDGEYENGDVRETLTFIRNEQGGVDFVATIARPNPEGNHLFLWRKSHASGVIQNRRPGSDREASPPRVSRGGTGTPREFNKPSRSAGCDHPACGGTFRDTVTVYRTRFGVLVHLSFCPGSRIVPRLTLGSILPDARGVRMFASCGGLIRSSRMSWPSLLDAQELGDCLPGLLAVLLIGRLGFWGRGLHIGDNPFGGADQEIIDDDHFLHRCVVARVQLAAVHQVAQALFCRSRQACIHVGQLHHLGLLIDLLAMKVREFRDGHVVAENRLGTDGSKRVHYWILGIRVLSAGGSGGAHEQGKQQNG